MVLRFAKYECCSFAKDGVDILGLAIHCVIYSKTIFPSVVVKSDGYLPRCFAAW